MVVLWYTSLIMIPFASFLTLFGPSERFRQDRFWFSISAAMLWFFIGWVF